MPPQLTCTWQNHQMAVLALSRPRGVRGIMVGLDSLALVWQHNLIEINTLANLQRRLRRQRGSR